MISNLKIKKASYEDLPQIVYLLQNDKLGKKRESYQDPLPKSYLTAFEEINSDKNQYLVVVQDESRIIGTMQLTIITYLTYQGGKRSQIEGVRIDEFYRGKGVGKFMIKWAILKSRELGCHLIQLTTDKKRLDAIEFYLKLGFIPSHEGLKLHL